MALANKMSLKSGVARSTVSFRAGVGQGLDPSNMRSRGSGTNDAERERAWVLGIGQKLL